MTITEDEIDKYSDVSRAILARLQRFMPLFRKKHEMWTYEAYVTALSDLDTLHGEMIGDLRSLVKPTAVKPATVTPFRRG
jgi:hypothetical protein